MPEELAIELDDERKCLRWDCSNLKDIVKIHKRARYARMLLGAFKVPATELVFERKRDPKIFSDIVYKDIMTEPIDVKSFLSPELPLCVKLDGDMALKAQDSLIVVAGIFTLR